MFNFACALMFFGALRIEELLPGKKGERWCICFKHCKVSTGFLLLFIAQSQRSISQRWLDEEKGYGLKLAV